MGDCLEWIGNIWARHANVWNRKDELFFLGCFFFYSFVVDYFCCWLELNGFCVSWNYNLPFDEMRKRRHFWIAPLISQDEKSELNSSSALLVCDKSFRSRCFFFDLWRFLLSDTIQFQLGHTLRLKLQLSHFVCRCIDSSLFVKLRFSYTPTFQMQLSALRHFLFIFLDVGRSNWTNKNKNLSKASNNCRKTKSMSTLEKKKNPCVFGSNCSNSTAGERKKKDRNLSPKEK